MHILQLRGPAGAPDVDALRFFQIPRALRLPVALRVLFVVRKSFGRACANKPLSLRWRSLPVKATQ